MDGDIGVRGDVEAEVRALTEDGTTRTLFVGELEPLGLEARRARGAIVELTFGVGVSGGVDTVLDGVIRSRGRSRSDERVGGDGGKFGDG